MAAGLAVQGITKNLIFSTRRTDKAVNNSENIVVSFGNADVASGQIRNALDAASLLAKDSKIGIASGFKGAHAALKTMSDGSAVIKGVGKVIEFTAEHINPVITVVGGAKVITAKDKEEAFIDEAPALLGMFAFEGVTKNVLEMEKRVKDPVTGKKISVKRTSVLKSNPMLKAQSEYIERAIEDYCSTKKLFNKISLKPLPNIAKGLIFVGMSIGGYEAGKSIGKNINNKRKAHKNKTLTFKPNNVQEAKIVNSRQVA